MAGVHLITRYYVELGSLSQHDNFKLDLPLEHNSLQRRRKE